MGPVRNRTGHPRVDQVGAVPHHPNRQDRCAARVDGSDVAVVGSSVPFATIALPIATGPARFPAFHFAARATVSADGWTTTASAVHSTRSKLTTDHSARGPTVRSSSAATAGKLRRSTRWPPGTASARSARARRSSRTDASSPPRRRTRASPIDKTTEAISPSPSIATASRAHAYVTLASACDQRDATRSRGSAIRIGTCFRTVAWTVTRAGGASTSDSTVTSSGACRRTSRSKGSTPSTTRPSRRPCTSSGEAATRSHCTQSSAVMVVTSTLPAPDRRRHPGSGPARLAPSADLPGMPHRQPPPS